MSSYPVRVQRDHYSGRNPRRRERQQRYNEVAALCERYLNGRIVARADNRQTYLYPNIAHDLGLDVEEVRRVLFGVDGGHNGLTVVKNAARPF
jgi:hypothetical protein